METLDLNKKRKPGRPKKGEELTYKARHANDPNQSWTPEKGLEKMELRTRAKVDELYPEPQLPKHFSLTTTGKNYFTTLYYHFQENGIDTKKYLLALIQLAKLYAHEEACEKELRRIKSPVAYQTNSKDITFREHPAAKHLHSTRTLILSYLKSLGLMPTAQGGIQKDNGEENPFYKLSMLKK